VTAADRARELVGPAWDTMDSGTRIALTVLAGEMDQQRDREADLKHEIAGLRKILYSVLGTIIAAAIGNGVLTILQ
jgi:hypothetical protein